MEPLKQPTPAPIIDRWAWILASTEGRPTDGGDEINPYFGKDPLPLLKSDLLTGTYDEEQETAKFKAAVEEWRNAGKKVRFSDDHKNYTTTTTQHGKHDLMTPSTNTEDEEEKWPPSAKESYINENGEKVFKLPAV